MLDFQGISTPAVLQTTHLIRQLLDTISDLGGQVVSRPECYAPTKPTPPEMMVWKMFCWWKISCTSWHSKFPMIYSVLYIPGGAGFLPSTVSPFKYGVMLGIQPLVFRGVFQMRSFAATFREGRWKMRKISYGGSKSHYDWMWFFRLEKSYANACLSILCTKKDYIKIWYL